MSVISCPNTIKKNLENKSVFIFDFDGVIVDSINIKGNVFAKLYENYGENVVNKVRHYHLLNPGVSRFEKFAYFHKYFLNKELDQKELNLISDQFSSLVMEKVINSKEIRGAKRFLQNSFHKGKLCFINSATPSNELKIILKSRGLDKFFSDYYGSPSTKEDNLKKILNTRSIDLECCIFFGDALADYNAAKALSMDFIGIGQNIENYFRSMKGDYFVIENFEVFNNGS